MWAVPAGPARARHWQPKKPQGRSRHRILDPRRLSSRLHMSASGRAQAAWRVGEKGAIGAAALSGKAKARPSVPDAAARSDGSDPPHCESLGHAWQGRRQPGPRPAGGTRWGGVARAPARSYAHPTHGGEGRRRYPASRPSIAVHTVWTATPCRAAQGINDGARTPPFPSLTPCRREHRRPQLKGKAEMIRGFDG